ncbi:hypothetical protein ACPOL_0019 [Acidisarcina polymorpha]|uniref:BrnT family toxin n=1 Tax=Acidisarcina polymorpha TaxID=2211140 RepID=A0A2Z5FSG1_9BACT|nr:BrnT family toxin [Acidisarcina polymorpha]AXC09406.1 hypothetical protein ACPOL_0019 [Acidisarcina polymorpha]
MRPHRPLDLLADCIGFDWDDANLTKNWDRHRVTPEEAEDVFFQEPIIMSGDAGHAGREKRYRLLGQTGAGRRLFVAFTVRRKLVRVISARDMNRRESESFASYEKNYTEGDS